MKIYAIGTDVSIHTSQNDIPAKVNAVIIKDTGVSYECIWWSDHNTRKCEWISGFEVGDSENSDTQKIGFK